MKKIIILALLLTATTTYGAWEIVGNNITTGNYFGTNNAQDLIFKTNNFERLKIKTQVNGTATNIEFPTNLVSMKLGNTVFMQSNGSITGLYSPNSFLNMKSNGANFDGGTNVNINQGAELRFYNGNTYSGLKSSPNATDTTWTLPENDSIGCLYSDGQGKLSFQSGYVITSGSYQASLEDRYIETTDGQITLPNSPQTPSGKVITVINTGTEKITINVQNGQQIGNTITESDYFLNSNESVSLINNGYMWRVIK